MLGYSQERFRRIRAKKEMQFKFSLHATGTEASNPFYFSTIFDNSSHLCAICLNRTPKSPLLSAQIGKITKRTQAPLPMRYLRIETNELTQNTGPGSWDCLAYSSSAGTATAKTERRNMMASALQD